jgi:hypothetical protein
MEKMPHLAGNGHAQSNRIKPRDFQASLAIQAKFFGVKQNNGPRAIAAQIAKIAQIVNSVPYFAASRYS